MARLWLDKKISTTQEFLSLILGAGYSKWILVMEEETAKKFSSDFIERNQKLGKIELAEGLSIEHAEESSAFLNDCNYIIDHEGYIVEIF